MKILYVGVLAIPIRDILTGKTEKEITGWPAYFQPVYRLLKAGHNIDFIFESNLKDYDIRVDWFSEKQIIKNIYLDGKRRSRFGFLSKCYYRISQDIKLFFALKKAIRDNNYDFIYCQEIGGVWGNYFANKYSVPCGVRIYGDTFSVFGRPWSKYEFIQKYGTIGLFLVNPKMLLLYKMSKSFMLTTADGTNGDKTYQLLKPRKNPYAFFYWKTGVRKSPPLADEDIELRIRGIDYIVYPARIDSLKNQYYAIDVLSEIHSKGYQIHMFLIGQICSEEYYNSLLDRIRMKNLDGYVHFTGGITQNQVKVYASKAIACILTSNLSNRGNVFFELFALGVPIVAVNDGSLDDYIANGISGYLADDKKQMAEYVIKLIDDPSERKKLSSVALSISDEKVISDDERFNLEIELIKKYALHQTDIDIPHII